MRGFTIAALWAALIVWVASATVPAPGARECGRMTGGLACGIRGDNTSVPFKSRKD